MDLLTRPQPLLSTSDAVLTKPGLTITPDTMSNCSAPPGRQLITRRWVVYVIIISCLAVTILLLVMAGIIFSQNQNLQPEQPSNPPVSSTLQAPQSNLPQGFIMMSPDFTYTLAFGNDLQLFQTSTLGGSLIWFSGTTSASSTKAAFASSSYVMNHVKSQSLDSKSFYQENRDDENHENQVRNKVFTNTRTLNFSSTGILSIRDLNNQTLWQNSPTPLPVGPIYSLQLLNSGELQIVDETGQVFWSVNAASPSDISVVNAQFTFPGNRLLNPDMTLTKGNLQFHYASQEGQFMVKQVDEVLWSSTFSPPNDLSTYTAAYTFYGNLILFDQKRNTIWSSDTASLIPNPTIGDASSMTSRYNMNLSDTGRLELQYYSGMDTQFVPYFQTTTNASTQVIRNPSLPWSRSSLWSLSRSQTQMVIQSSDQAMQLLYESDGSLTLVNTLTNTRKTTSSRGDSLVLQGSEVMNISKPLVGALSLYQTGSAVPSWSFAPQSVLNYPQTQLPITLAFDSAWRLVLLTQDQQVVNTLSIDQFI